MTLIRLQRASERIRLERQFLIDAYEQLITHVVPDEHRSAGGDAITTEEEWSPEHAHASEACGIGND